MARKQSKARRESRESQASSVPGTPQTSEKANATPATKSPPARASRWRLLGAVLLLGVAAWLLLAQAMSVVAEQRLANGEPSRALQAAGWARRLRPWDVRPLLVECRAARQQGDHERAQRALGDAMRRAPESDRVRATAELAVIAAGGFHAAPEQIPPWLLEQAAPEEIVESLVLGYVAQRQARLAQTLLDVQPGELGQAPLIRALRGFISGYQQDWPEAIEAWRGVLAKSPRHELARRWLAGALFATGRFQESLDEYQQLVTLSGAATTADKIAIASCLRRLGRYEDAERLVLAVRDGAGRTPPVLAELGQLALERGQTAEALALLRDNARAGDSEAFEDLGAAAAITGDDELARQVFAEVLAERQRTIRLEDLEVRTRVDPLDAAARMEFERLQSQSD